MRIPFERGALIIVLRTLEGASKCALRLFLRLQCKFELIFVILPATRGCCEVMLSPSLLFRTFDEVRFELKKCGLGESGGGRE